MEPSDHGLGSLWRACSLSFYKETLKQRYCLEHRANHSGDIIYFACLLSLKTEMKLSLHNPYHLWVNKSGVV